MKNFSFLFVFCLDAVSDSMPYGGTFRVRTPFRPLSCLSIPNFFLYHWNASGPAHWNAAPRMFVKIIFKLKRTDIPAGGIAPDPVTIIHSYEIPNPIGSATNVTNGVTRYYTIGYYNYQGGGNIYSYSKFIRSLDGCPFFPNQSYNSGFTDWGTTFSNGGYLPIQGQILNQTINGHNVVRNIASVSISNSTIRSNTGILISEEGVILPNSTLEISRIGCTSSESACFPTISALFPSVQEIQSSCASSIYTAAAGIARTALDYQEDEKVVLPTTLGHPIPNPTTGECSLSFNLAEEGGYAIQLSNVLGETVRVLAKTEFSKLGPQSITFDTQGLEAGVYFITFTSEGFRQARKLVVVR